MRSTKFWIILVAVALIVSCAAAGAIYCWHGSGDIACIYQDGELIKTIHLDTVTSPYEFTVTWEGRENIVSVESGRICVSYADCPDQICVHTGWIGDGVTPIVCLPNRLSIRIQSDTVDAAVQ